MYCNSCGKPNPDGSAFCSSCGKALAPSPTSPTLSHPAPTVNNRYTTKIDQKNETLSHFRQSWRTLAASPFALVLIICHSVAQLLNIININSLFTSSNEFTSILSMLNSQAENSMNTALSLLQLLIIAPGVLIAISLWMLYADARDRSDRPINTMGLTIIRGTEIAALIFCCILALLAIFSSCNALDELADVKGQYASDIRSALTTAVMTLLAIIAFAIVVYRLTIKLLTTIRESADYCSPNTDYVTSNMVICFIGGGISVISVLSAGITLSTAVSAALPFLFGIMLLKYKQLMTTLYHASIKQHSRGTQNNYASSFVQQSSQHIPAWQRVETEREKAESNTTQD